MNREKIRFARKLRNRQTESEERLWAELRGNKLLGFKFRRQHPVRGYVVDFYCHQLNLVIEVDGSVHDKTREWDEFRQRVIMEKTGATFLRFTNEDVLYHLNDVIKHISTFVTPHPWPSPHGRGPGGQGSTL